MDLSSWQSLCYFLFLAIPLSVLLVLSHFKKKPRSVGLNPLPLLGDFLEFLHNRHRLMDWVTDKLLANPTHTVVFRIPSTGVVTANPANVEYMLKTNFDNYPKGLHFTSLMEDLMGHGIFNSDGEQWRAQRKTVSFELNKRSFRSIVMDTVRGEVHSQLLPLLEAAGDNGELLDLQSIMDRFTFDNICQISFGVNPASLGGEGAAMTPTGERVPVGFMRDFDDACNITVDRFMYAVPLAWQIKRLLNLGTERQLRESLSSLHSFAAEIVRTRKLEAYRSGCRADDDNLLSRFAAEADHSEKFLREVVINFMVAGRDTTASALTWFFWVLSSRPDVERKILEEVAAIRARSQGTDPTEQDTFSYDELREMHYLHAAISESIRLYPPVPMNHQECLKDDVLPDGTLVKRGWYIAYSPYAMGRMEDIWGEDCREYRPERWLDAEGVLQPGNPFQFSVFHAGPRMCLGKEVAYIQMKSLVACVLERFAVEVVDRDNPPVPVVSMSLRMKSGLSALVRKREGA